jgi:multiple sugar transport system permease protein
MTATEIIRRRRKRRENIFAVIFALIFLFPIYWIVVNSFKLDGEIFQNPPTLWPTIFTFDNYKAQIGSLAKPFLNSLVISVTSMIITLVLGVPAAYGLARYKLRTTKIILLVFLITQMLPSSLVLTPLYLIFNKMGLINTFLSPILSVSTGSIPFVVLFLRPGFLTIPDELMESAKIDGCTTIQAFFRIVVPVAKASVITAACFGFIMGWNNLVYPMTFITKDTMRPMTASVYKFMDQFGMEWGKIMAYGTLLVIPPIIIFITMQKYVVSGLVGSSVKG